MRLGNEGRLARDILGTLGQVVTGFDSANVGVDSNLFGDVVTAGREEECHKGKGEMYGSSLEPALSKPNGRG